MRSLTRTLTISVILLAFAGGAAATPGGHATLDATAHDSTAHAETLLDADARYLDADVAAVTDGATAALDTDANVAEAESVKDGGFFGWFEVRLGAVVDKLSIVFDKLGLSAPEADASAEVYASDDGVDLDASAQGHDFDRSPVGDLDGKTFEAASTVKGHVEEAKAKLG